MKNTLNMIKRLNAEEYNYQLSIINYQIIRVMKGLPLALLFLLMLTGLTWAAAAVQQTKPAATVQPVKPAAAVKQPKSAITVTAPKGIRSSVSAPATALVGQSVSVSVSATLVWLGPDPGANCDVEIDFGDGSPAALLGTCVLAGSPCPYSTSHVYTLSNVYTITAREKPGTCSGGTITQATTSLTVNCPALSIPTASPLPTGTAGTAYSTSIQPSGGISPYKIYSLTGTAPPELSIAPSSGYTPGPFVISGTPATAGNYSFTLKVIDSCGAGQIATKTFSLTIGCPAVSITSPSSLSTGTVGTAYSATITASGGQSPYTYSLVSGSLPAGMTLSAGGLITCTPTTAGTSTFTVNVADSCGAGVQNAQKPITIITNQRPAGFSVNITPSSFKLPRGTASSQTFLYTFSSSTTGDIPLRSDKGVFMAGGSVIGEVNMPLTVTITNGRGAITETVSIPPAVSQRAENLGRIQIIFVRTFLDGNISAAAQAGATVTTEAGADFKVKRLQVYFDNKRAETTVERNQKALKAYADISFSGSGLLQGYWEVDGRLISNVSRNLIYGENVMLETPAIPELPTFDPGTHIVRLVITNPVGISSPEALYFVTAQEAKEMLRLKLISPVDKSEVAYSAIDFTWEGKGQSATYRIEFMEKGKNSPVFSAYTKTPAYKLPEPVLKSIFSPGRDYLWQVKSLEADGSITGESPEYSFTFTESHSHVPGQLLVVAEASERGGEALKRLADKYHLSIVENFDISSLHLKVAVFYTKEDIFKVIRAVMTESGIVMAQPNYIFGTMAESAKEMQTLNRALNLGRLHKQYSGKGVIVAVIDTGVDISHIALKDRVIYSENLIKDSAYNAEVHGTAVAGIIAANTKDLNLSGIAPGADILALRACRQLSEAHPEGDCYTTSIAKAIDIALEKKARIVNMSFGSPSPDSLITRLIDEGSKKGVIFVAPVGNNARQKNLVFPASHPEVLSVAGIDAQGHSYPNSEIAAKARLSAPSANIYTTIPGDKFNFISGTSMSSAMVSGVMALAIEKNGSVDIHKLPVFNGDICRWNEELLKIALCGK